MVDTSTWEEGNTELQDTPEGVFDKDKGYWINKPKHSTIITQPFTPSTTVNTTNTTTASVESDWVEDVESNEYKEEPDIIESSYEKDNLKKKDIPYPHFVTKDDLVNIVIRSKGFPVQNETSPFSADMARDLTKAPLKAEVSRMVRNLEDHIKKASLKGAFEVRLYSPSGERYNAKFYSILEEYFTVIGYRFKATLKEGRYYEVNISWAK